MQCTPLQKYKKERLPAIKKTFFPFFRIYLFCFAMQGWQKPNYKHIEIHHFNCGHTSLLEDLCPHYPTTKLSCSLSSPFPIINRNPLQT